MARPMRVTAPKKCHYGSRQSICENFQPLRVQASQKKQNRYSIHQIDEVVDGLASWPTQQITKTSFTPEIFLCEAVR